MTEDNIGCLLVCMSHINFQYLLSLQMCHCIEKVFQLAVSTFSKTTPQDMAKKNLELLVAQTNKLKREDVGLENCSVFQSSLGNNSSRKR